MKHCLKRLYKNYKLETLTSKKYWEDYYNKSNTDKDAIIKICSKYDNLFDVLVASCSRPPETIIEIGAYPGRFLAYLSAKYSLEATALDYNSDTNKIRDSFTAMEGGIEGDHSGLISSA